MSRSRKGLVASLGVALVVAACSSSTPATTGPSTEASVAPTAGASAAGPAFLSSFNGPGTYRTGLFKPRMAVTIPASWKPGAILSTFVGADESEGGFVLNDGKAVVIVTAPTSIFPPAPGDAGKAVPSDAAGLIAALAADTHLKNATAPAPVTIAGATGVQFEADLDAAYDCSCPDPGFRMTDYLLVKAGSHVRIAAVPLGGALVIVATVAPSADWAAESKAADGIIASLAPAG